MRQACSLLARAGAAVCVPLRNSAEPQKGGLRREAAHPIARWPDDLQGTEFYRVGGLAQADQRCQRNRKNVKASSACTAYYTTKEGFSNKYIFVR